MGYNDRVRPSTRLLLIIASALTAAYLVGIAFNLSPWLRGPEEWRWPYVIPLPFSRAWLSAVVLLGYMLIIAFLLRRGTSRRWIVLSLLIAGLMTPVLQMALLYVDHADLGISQLFNRTVSELSGGFYNVGVLVTDNRDFLSHFVERMPTFPVHPQRHPPGLPLVFAWARQLFDRLPVLAAELSGVLRPNQCHNLALMNMPNSAIAASIIQMLVPVWLGFVVGPLYLFGRQIYDERTAQAAVLLWPLLPSVALWATRWNQLYALITLAAFIPFVWGLRHRRLWPLFLAGLVVAVGSFFSLGNVVLVMFLGLFALMWLADESERPGFGWLVAGAGLFIAGFTLFWLIIWRIYGLNPLALWQTALGLHMGLGRSYLSWLFYHLYDFLVFFGIALAVFWAFRFVRAGARWRVRPRDMLALSFGAGLILLDLSGTSQGEVARVWAFLFPLALLASVPRDKKSRTPLLIVAGLLAAQVFVSNLFLQPVSTGLTDPPAPPASMPASQSPVAIWENGLMLDRVNLPRQLQPGESVAVELFWGTSQSIPRPYTIFIHLIDPEGQLVAQSDGLPRGGQWLTTCWQPHLVFNDTYQLDLPEDLPPGEYNLVAGFYWLPTGERVSLADGSESAGLGLLNISSSTAP